MDTEPRAFGHIVNIAEEAAKEEIERLRRRIGNLEAAKGEALLWILGEITILPSNRWFDIAARMVRIMTDGRYNPGHGISLRPTQDQPGAWFLRCDNWESRVYAGDLDKAWKRARQELSIDTVREAGHLLSTEGK